MVEITYWPASPVFPRMRYVPGGFPFKVCSAFSRDRPRWARKLIMGGEFRLASLTYQKQSKKSSKASTSMTVCTSTEVRRSFSHSSNPVAKSRCCALAASLGSILGPAAAGKPSVAPLNFGSSHRSLRKSANWLRVRVTVHCTSAHESASSKVPVMAASAAFAGKTCTAMCNDGCIIGVTSASSSSYKASAPSSSCSISEFRTIWLARSSSVAT
mmetsp:Transcript_21234/g.55409  ORF Transcript_21234/g.55409 Transcript_21234/m.55409 type:complete len:214 (-) Transcript_21234:1077-1718(-)